MATLKEYFDKDFSNCIKLHVILPTGDILVDGVICYDFVAYIAYSSFYVSRGDITKQFYEHLLGQLSYGKTEFQFNNAVTLPSAKEFLGTFNLENKDGFKISAKFFGDTDWIGKDEMQSSKRIFIYSESNLTDDEIRELKITANSLGHNLQFRSEKYRSERSMREKPLAFISHDSRDKEAVARKVSKNLQKMLCPVWYDEYSLKVGDHLRESIEKGLKECKKCILILSPSFLSNNGWTKTEFDSIFTRQILEESKLVLPIWYDVTKNDVYEYSPSLLNIKGLNWKDLGEDEVCRQLYQAIMS